MVRSDIRSRADVQALVDAFYARIEEDPVIGRFFRGLDLASHLQTMYAFWARLLLREPGSVSGLLAPHARMAGLTPAHFERWLERFWATVDAHFAGPGAQAAKLQALHVSRALQYQLCDGRPSAPPPAPAPRKAKRGATIRAAPLPPRRPHARAR